MKREDLILDMRFRWRELPQNKVGCGECMLSPEECPNDCDKQGYYDMLTEEEWKEVEFKKFLETHPNFGHRISKKLDALLVEFKENFDKLDDEQKGRYLNNCNYLQELFKIYDR